MSFLERIRQDMLEAAKAKDTVRLDVLKLAIASLKNAEVEKGEPLTDPEQEQILRKELKKLQDAYEQYVSGGREDLAEKEKCQLEVIQSYLPELMGEDEIRDFVESKVTELGAESPGDIGKIMGVVMKELSGKADGALVKKVVQDVLNAD